MGAGDGSSHARRICQLCVETLDVCGAGISLVSGSGDRVVVSATDGAGARVEDLQFTLGEGPCVDAVSGGVPVLFPDLGRSGGLTVDRWPLFLAGAAGAGVRAVFAFPLRIGAISVGAMDLCRDRPGELSADQLSAALQAADAAAVALLEAGSWDGEAGPAGLRPVEDYDVRVHQATGMVQVQLGISTKEALLRLRAHAFANDRPMAAVAADVVNRRLRFSGEDP